MDQSVFICFTALPSLALAIPLQTYAIGQRVIQEVHENGSVDPSHERKGRKKEGRRERTRERGMFFFTLQNLESALPYCLRAYDHYK